MVFVCRVWRKCFYFCLFNLCAFALRLPFRASLNLARLQIPNSQQISALPSVGFFFLRWHANTRKPQDSPSSQAMDAAQTFKKAVLPFLPRTARRQGAAASPMTGGKSLAPWQVSTWLLPRKAINQLRDAPVARGFHHPPDKTQLSFKCEMKPR